MARKTTKHRRLLPALLAAAALAAGYLHWENSTLQLSFFDRSFARLPHGFDGCRIAVISDLHGAEFGEKNEELFSALNAQAPEYIFFLGDLEDRFRGAQEGFAETVAAGLSAIAPTYYITGNHEWANGDVPALKKRLEHEGVTVLSNRYVPLERNGDTIILAGIDDPNGYADQKTPEQLTTELYAEHGDSFWLLLAHRGNRFPTQYSFLGADLVLSGHGHGGIWRLPFTDGLVGNDFELFPTHMAGFYEENGSTLFATRGLGNSGRSFRFLNRPEIAILTLHTKQG
ncbi:MAG: metallophosphoesterase family protein [Oscillibacter sp.]|nr:metallophosphoesterase family protein [Oscillibacter sp.]